MEPIKCPEVLEDLLDNNKQFVSNSRRYNNALALASNGLKEIIPPGSRFHPNVKIQGKVYHRIDPLTPGLGAERSFAQIYIHDSEFDQEDELNRRMAVSSKGSNKLNKEVMKKLQELLHQNNPFVKDFKHVMDLPDEDVKDLKFVLKTHAKPQPNRIKGTYNLPTCNEIALVALNDETESTDVVLYRKEGGIQSINNVHRCYDPLHYVLIFPFGEDGWYDGLTGVSYNKKEKKEVVRKISMRDFYAFRLQIRYKEGRLESPSLFKSARLFQEYVCDQWAKIEAYKLRWVKNNQTTIRAETYKGLMDAINHNDDATTVGQRIILPSSIYGSPRWYAQAYQDSIATVRKYGKPTIFITYSCNPKCEEIKKSLLPGQTSQDRPDIVCRVYKMQVGEMMKDIVAKQAFGKVTSYTVVVEFQKRGLPHTHQVYTLADEDKPKTPEEIDRIVLAEIPNPITNPKLYEEIQHMVHGPCGSLNPEAQCMQVKNGVPVCSKGYPKPFQQETSIDKYGHVHYRRRNNGRTVPVYCAARRQNFDLDNRWIVPYNPALLLKYKGHVNAEMVNTIMTTKYIHKYFTKGPDRCLVQATDGSLIMDELNSYLDSRFIGATEACWKTLEFPLRWRYPPVEKLAVHLEDHQSVLFKVIFRKNQVNILEVKVNVYCRYLG